MNFKLIDRFGREIARYASLGQAKIGRAGFFLATGRPATIEICDSWIDDNELMRTPVSISAWPRE